MKSLVRWSLLSLVLLSAQHGSAFENLDFEQAMPVTTGDEFTICCDQRIEDTLPHWSATQFNFANSTTISEDPDVGAYYNSWHIGVFPAIFNLTDGGDPNIPTAPFLTFPPVEGMFSLSIDTRELLSAELFQTGIVPTGSRSIRFSGDYFDDIFAIQPSEPPAENIDLYLEGNKLSVLELSRTGEFKMYGANIPAALAGNSAELRFSVKTNELLFLDDIQFSPIPVPEPTTLTSLLIFCGLVSPRGWHRQSAETSTRWRSNLRPTVGASQVMTW